MTFQKKKKKKRPIITQLVCITAGTFPDALHPGICLPVVMATAGGSSLGVLSSQLKKWPMLAV